MSETESLRPLGSNHALLCGMVATVLMTFRSPDDEVGLFEAEPELDGADYTGRTLIHRPSGTWAVQVVPVRVHEL